MKQIITLLLVILVSIPVNAQSIEQEKQELENLTTAKFFKPIHNQNERLRNIQTRDQILKRKAESLKSLEKRYLDSLVNQTWDEDLNLWKFSSKEEFSYNNDKIEMTILYVWNPNNSSWRPFQKNEYTFDVNGYLSSEIESYQFYFSPPGVWTLVEKTDYTYFQNIDNVYILNLEETFSWDNVTNQWVNTYKYELTYDSNGYLVTMELGSEWDSFTNNWMNMYKDEFFYDSMLLSYKINSLWNYGTSQWDLNSKWVYSRGDFHPWVLDFEIQYRWETDPTGYWIIESSIDYEWTGVVPHVYLLNETKYTWNINIIAWENDSKDEYQYDGNGNRTIGTYFEWNESESNWHPYYKDEFIFDLAYDFDDLIGPFYSVEGLDESVYKFNNMVIGYRGYEFIDPIWEDINKMLFYYSNYTNPLQIDDKILADIIKLYPNPVNDILSIDSEIQLTKVEFYSLVGKKIMEVNNGFDTIPLSNLSDGIYLVKISADNKVVVKKIIKHNMIL